MYGFFYIYNFNLLIFIFNLDIWIIYCGERKGVFKVVRDVYVCYFEKSRKCFSKFVKFMDIGGV